MYVYMCEKKKRVYVCVWERDGEESEKERDEKERDAETETETGRWNQKDTQRVKHHNTSWMLLVL